MLQRQKIMQKQSSSKLKRKRDAAVDDFRAGLTLILVLYHVAQAFDFGPNNHIKAPARDRRA